MVFSSGVLLVCPTRLPGPLPCHALIGHQPALNPLFFFFFLLALDCDVWFKYSVCHFDVLALLTPVGFTESSSIFWTRGKCTTWPRMDPCRGTLVFKRKILTGLRHLFPATPFGAISPAKRRQGSPVNHPVLNSIESRRHSESKYLLQDLAKPFEA